MRSREAAWIGKVREDEMTAKKKSAYFVNMRQIYKGEIEEKLVKQPLTGYPTERIIGLIKG